VSVPFTAATASLPERDASSRVIGMRASASGSRRLFDTRFGQVGIGAFAMFAA
jgi:hypothetical protein